MEKWEEGGRNEKGRRRIKMGPRGEIRRTKLEVYMCMETQIAMQLFQCVLI